MSRGTIKYARIGNSSRLQRILAVLADGQWHSTLDISQRTGNCAVGVSIVEIRRNGIPVTCRIQKAESGRFWEYRIGRVEP